MKKLVMLVLAILSYSSTVFADDVRGAVVQARFAYRELSRQQHLLSFQVNFSMGSQGGSCPQLTGYTTARSNDTLLVKAFYDIRGIWPAMGCGRQTDTTIGDSLVGISYINASANIITYDSLGGLLPDTVMNVRDSTFMRRPAAGVESFGAAGRMVIAPNPWTDHLTIRWTGTEPDLSVQVTDITGTTVWSRRIGPGESEITLDGLSVPAGTYFVRLFSGSRMQAVQRLVKTN